MDLCSTVSRKCVLPDPRYAGLWDSTVVDKALKECLLGSIAFALRLQESLPFEITALQGTAFLHGLPGTSKTALARGPVHESALFTQQPKVKFIKVNPHGLLSAEHGQTCSLMPIATGSIVPTLHGDERGGSGRAKDPMGANGFAVPDGLLANRFQSSRGVLNSGWPVPMSCQAAPSVDEASIHHG